VLLRIGTAALALLVAGWLALSLYDALHTIRAVELTVAAAAHGSSGDANGSREYAQRALASARSARALNPDRAPDTYAAVAVWLLGRRAESLRQLDALARAQPDDAFVWLSMLTVARGADPAREARARAQIAALHPPPPGR